MLRQLDDLYIPKDERTLRRIQRKSQDLERRVRGWSNAVIEVMPKGLGLLEDESYILGLFLAQQRRLNMQIDSERGDDPTVGERLGRMVPFLDGGPDSPQIVQAYHRTVALKLDSDIDRACGFFCRDQNVPALSDPAIDWRVALRFMAQSVHSLAASLDIKKLPASPRRFELAVMARELSGAVVDRRRAMYAAFGTLSKR